MPRGNAGVILYQDQVLQVCQALAGFTTGQAEALRRAMSRRRSHDLMAGFWEEFRLPERHLATPASPRRRGRGIAFAKNSSQKPAIRSCERRRLIARRSASACSVVNPASAWQTCST